MSSGLNVICVVSLLIYDVCVYKYIYIYICIYIYIYIYIVHASRFPPACIFGCLGAKQPNRQPANQPANCIKNQTRWVQNPAKIQQVGAQNPPSWGPKSSKIGPGGALGRLWAPSWPKMAPRAKKNPKIHQKCTQNGPNLEAKIHQKSFQKRSKM